MRATRVSDVLAWHESLIKLKDTRNCSSPGFFMPYHFVTLALLLKEEQAKEVNLLPEFTSYAARMRLWEAIGLESPVTIPGRATSSRFHEITPLRNLDAVDSVATALTEMLAASGARPCDKDTQDSLYIMLAELLGNCHHHARMDAGLHGLVCAQTWYKGARAQFAIADSGIGIRKSLGENPDLANRLAKQNSCKLATQLGISSKLNRGHAGYGLTVARDLAMQTPNATFIVQSCDEVVVVQDGKIAERGGVKHAVGGTLVVFEWDTNKPLDVGGVYRGWPKTENDDDEFF